MQKYITVFHQQHPCSIPGQIVIRASVSSARARAPAGRPGPRPPHAHAHSASLPDARSLPASAAKAKLAPPTEDQLDCVQFKVT